MFCFMFNEYKTHALYVLVYEVHESNVYVMLNKAVAMTLQINRTNSAAASCKNGRGKNIVKNFEDMFVFFAAIYV